jgi:hypothetical protein
MIPSALLLRLDCTRAPCFMHASPLIPPAVALKLFWSEYNQLNHKAARELYSSVRCDYLTASTATSLCDWYGFTVVDASSSRCPKAVIYVFFLEFCPFNLSALMKLPSYGGDAAAVFPTPFSMAARLGADMLPVSASFFLAPCFSHSVMHASDFGCHASQIDSLVWCAYTFRVFRRETAEHMLQRTLETRSH